MSHNICTNNQRKRIVMKNRKGQRLSEEKNKYVDYIADFMYRNHMSFKTLDATKASWREDREYNKNIEDELITQSITFLNILDKELNVDFRKKLARFMATYLSVYIAKAPRFAKYTNKKQSKALSELTNLFMDKLTKDEANRTTRKVAKRNSSKPKAPKKETWVRISCDYNIKTGDIRISNSVVCGIPSQIAATQHKHRARIIRIKTDYEHK